MDAIASQITSLTIVYSTVYWDSDQRKYQSSALLAFVRGIHRWPVNSPHKWPVTRKMFPFDDVIMVQKGQESVLMPVSSVLTTEWRFDSKLLMSYAAICFIAKNMPTGSGAVFTESNFPVFPHLFFIIIETLLDKNVIRRWNIWLLIHWYMYITPLLTIKFMVQRWRKSFFHKAHTRS